jgi:hypothetical protein
MSVVPILSLGFALGIAHATDADHVIAVSTMVGERAASGSQRGLARLGSALSPALRVGSLWGLGHTLTVVAVGGVLIAFRLVMPASLGLGLELCVAVMLIALGALGLRKLRGDSTHAAPARSPLRSLGVGVVHGLAGSAAVALAVLSEVDNPSLAVVYLAVFGAGTVLGMMMITSAMAMPFALSAKARGLMGWLQRGAAALSLVFGIILFVKIGFVEGLFTGSPTWSPH